MKDPGGGSISGAPVEWTSSDPSIVTIGKLSGLAEAVADGDVEITAEIGAGARIGEISLTPAALTVTPDVISSIQVSPLSAITVPGSTLQFTATARNADGADIQNAQFDWQSSDTTVADVTSAGLAIGVGVGDVVITASAGTVTSPPAPLVVTTVSSIEVLPTATSISIGNQIQFSATIMDEAGRLVQTENAEWSSSEAAVATVDSSGIATGVGAGITEISASAGGIVSDPNNPSLLTVTSVVTVDITPMPTATVDVTKTVQFTAVAKDGGGATIVGVASTWNSSNVLVATVDPLSGVLTGVSTGTTVVTASAEGVTSNAVTVTVTATGVPDSISMTVTPSPISVFGTTTVQATVRDAAGSFVPSFIVDFIVTDPSFGTISSMGTTDASGVATATFKAAEKPGTAIASATAGTKSSSVEISISPASTVSLEFKSADPPAIGLQGAGQTETSVVTFLVKDSNGNPVADGVKVCFTLKGPGPGAAITPTEGSTAGFGTSTAGEVETILQSGTVPGPARIVATVAQADSCASLTTIKTESAPVSIGGGVPDLAHFSLSLNIQNIASFLSDPRVAGIDNVQATLSTFIADQFGNFNVLEGTSVSYIIEAGSIDRSNTLDAQGSTSVLIRTQAPAPVDRDAGTDTDTAFGPGAFTSCVAATGSGCNVEDGFVTAVAMVKGQECFTDRNGNGVFDSATDFDTVTRKTCDQGEPFINANDNVFAAGDTFNSGGTTITVVAGDANVGRPKFDANELFVDVNENGLWDGPNGTWDGPLGVTGTETTIWKEITMAFSGEPDRIQAAYTRVNAGGGSDFCIQVGESQSITLRVGDNNDPNRGGTLDTTTATPADRPAGHAPMTGSTVTITTTAGELAGAGPFVIPNIVGAPFVRSFSIANTLELSPTSTTPVADAPAAIEVQVNWVVPGFTDQTFSIFISGILKGISIVGSPGVATAATC